MSTEAIVSLAAAFVTLSFGVMVFLANPKGSVNRMWFAFVGSLVVWGFGDIGIRIHADSIAAENFHELGILGFSFFPGLFLHFSLVFTGRWSGPARIPAVMILHTVGLAFAVLLFHGYILNVVTSEGTFTTGRGTGYEYFLAWMIFCLSAGLVFCFIKFLKTHSKPERAYFLFLFLGLAIPAAAGILADSAGLSDAIRPFYFTVGAIVTGVTIVSFVLGRLHFLAPSTHIVASRVLESAGDLVCVINREGYLTFATELFRNTLKIPPDRPLGAVHAKHFVVEYEKIYQILGEPMEDPGPIVTELHYRSLAGSKIPVSVSITRMFEKKKPSGLVLIARDISERRELARMVEESKEKYRDLVESSLDGIVVIQEGKLVFVNESAVRIFGYQSAEDMLSVRFEETVAPGSKPFLTEGIQGGNIGEDIFRNYEMKGLTKEAKIIDLEINAKLISWNGKSAVQASLRDITERKTLEREQALWFWEQESLMTIDRQLVAMVDLEKLLNAVTQHARAFTRAEFAGVILIHEERQTYSWRGVKGNREPFSSLPQLLRENHKWLLRKKSPVVIQNLRAESADIRKQFPALTREDLETIAGFPFRIKEDLQGVMIVGYRKDHAFSDREMRLLSSLAEKSAIAIANAELYEDLREREQDLENLTNARVAAQEEERRRIAREIHDGLGQMLTAIKFNVEVLEDTMGAGEVERKKLKEIRDLLDSVMTEAREISYNLMPSVLEDFGLSPALQLFCETFSTRMKVKVSYHSHGINGRFDRGLEVNLYRIAQEALNNVAKHAEASSVDVQLLRDDGGVRMTVEDDGKGFPQAGLTRVATVSGGTGIVSMRERAASFGGTLTIESSPGKGTTILVNIPTSKATANGTD